MGAPDPNAPAVLPPAIRDLYPFAPRWFDRPGCRMAFVDEGPRDAPAVVMVHGNPTWSFFYRSLVRALCDRFRCIVPDHAGCGRSEKPQAYAYSLSTHIDNLGALLDHLGVRRAHLVVHDWGGPIGLGAVRRRLEFLEGLVILNTAAFPSRRIPKRIAICRWPGLGVFLVRGCNAFSGAAVHLAVTRPLRPEVRAAYLWPHRTWADRVAVHRFVRDIPLRPGDRSFDEVRAIGESLSAYRGKPALIVWGGRDWCFDDEFLGEWRRRLPEARVVQLPEAGHWLLEDEPETVGREVGAFLDSSASGMRV